MADRYMSRIQIRRGLRSQFPNLNDGEIGYAVDTKELFIGYNREHISILTDSQADKIYSDLTNIKDKIEYFKERENHINYDLQVGSENLIANGNFDLPIISGEMGINLIGERFTKTFIEDISDLGIGSQYAFTVLNETTETSGIVFSFIDKISATESVGKDYTLQFFARYQNIIPGFTSITENLQLGRISLTYEFEDGTSEVKNYTCESILTGSDGWKKYEYHFKTMDENFTKSVVSVIGSVSFELVDASGEFSITGVKLEEGHIATSNKSISSKEIKYRFSQVDESIENILKNNAMTKEELLIKYTQLETKVSDNTKNIDTLFSRFNLVKYTAKNRLRNSGEFTTDLYWSMGDKTTFRYSLSNRLMTLSKLKNMESYINIETVESLFLNNDITVSILYHDYRTNTEKLDVRLMSKDFSYISVDNYTIENVDLDRKLFVGKVNKTEEFYKTIDFLSIYDTFFNTNESITIVNMKVEYGKINTDWYPAPEDTVHSIRNYEEVINNIESNLNDLNRTCAIQDMSIKTLKDNIGDLELMNGVVTSTSLDNIPQKTIIENGNIKDILNTILFKPRSPIIESIKGYTDDYSYNKVENIYIIGNVVNVGRLEIKFNTFNETCKSVLVSIDSKIYPCTIRDDGVAIYNFHGNMKVVSNKSFIITVITDTGKETTGVFKIDFVPPVYYGSTTIKLSEVSQNLLSSGNINKQLDSDVLSFRFNHNKAKAFVAIPNTLITEINGIYDSNYLNYIDSFQVKNVIVALNGVLYDYTVYLQEHLTKMDNVVFKINLKGGSVNL